MAVLQIKTTWTGGPSAPGLTLFNVENSGVGDFDAALAAVQSFWTTVSSPIPDEYKLQVDQTAFSYNEADGSIQGLQTGTNPLAQISGQGPGSYSHGTGTRIDWATSAIARRRRVRGRTFIVPLTHASFGPDGYLTAATVTYLEDAAYALLSALETAGLPLVVWSRPTTEYPLGEINPVIDANVPTKVAVLRGRRD